MEITDLIKFYKLTLEDERRFRTPGFCHFIIFNNKSNLSETQRMELYRLFNRFNLHSYYHNCFTHGLYLFRPHDWTSRDQFMKDEIKELKTLLKQGYTHI